MTHTRLPNLTTPADRWGTPPPLGPSHTSVSPASKWRSCPTQGDIGQSHARRRNGGHNIIVTKAQTDPQTEPARESNSWQTDHGRTQRHGHTALAPIPHSRVAHYKQCNRALAKPGQANLVHKVNMKLTHALSDRVRPIGAIGPGTGWRHSPEGRDSQRLNGAWLADAKTGDTQQTRAQLWHDPHSETPLPAIADGQDPDRHGPIQRPRQRSRTRAATAGATPRHHQAGTSGLPRG